MSFQRVAKRLDGMIPDIIEWQKELTAVPALGPDNDGEGEDRKAELIAQKMKALRPDETHEIRAPDDRVPCGYRPNLVYLWKGADSSKKIWVLSHMDIVPPGQRQLWDSDPYVLRVDGNKLYGRGVEDNQHGLVSSVAAVKAILEENATPAHDMGLVFVADEETGSKYGLQYLLKHRADLFASSDLIVVPDAGNEDGTLIEVAEKSMLWLKFRVLGKQCHASMPEQGINSLRGTARLVIALERLYSTYAAEDPLFHPPRSTFEPTKKEANVPNVNTIPGEDVFYLDSRVLPQYHIDEVQREAERICRTVEQDTGVRIEVEAVMKDQASVPTPADAPVVMGLQKAVKAVYDREAQPGGIGGGTVAAFFRRAGLPVAVWSTSCETAHQPNEYCPLDALVGDAKVFAHLFLNPD